MLDPLEDQIDPDKIDEELTATPEGLYYKGRGPIGPSTFARLAAIDIMRSVGTTEEELRQLEQELEFRQGK